MDYFFLGESELVTAFRFAGVDGKAVSSAGEAISAFTELTASEDVCNILILSEQISDWLGETLTSWQLSGKYPLIVEVPPFYGHTAGRKTLVDSIREAIGIHV